MAYLKEMVVLAGWVSTGTVCLCLWWIDSERCGPTDRIENRWGFSSAHLADIFFLVISVNFTGKAFDIHMFVFCHVCFSLDLILDGKFSRSENWQKFKFKNWRWGEKKENLWSNSTTWGSTTCGYVSSRTKSLLIGLDLEYPEMWGLFSPALPSAMWF